MLAATCWVKSIVIGVIALAYPMISLGYPLSPAEHDAIEQQQKQRLERAQQQRAALQNATPEFSSPEVSAVREEGPCFPIRQIQLRDATVLSSSQHAEFSRLPDTACLRLADIRQRVNDITQLYLSMGYITSRAWLPEQDIASGVLQINVIEGRVEALTLDGQSERSLQMAFGNIVGQMLNLRDIEQGLEQLNRLASRPVTVDILPGSTPGYSVLQLSATDTSFPLSLRLGADNSGQKSTGERQFSGSLVADNLLRLADQWTLTATRDSEFHADRQSRSLQAGVSVPYGYWLFNAQYGWSDSYQPLLSGKWRYEGSVQTERIAAGRTLVVGKSRDAVVKLGQQAMMTRRHPKKLVLRYVWHSVGVKVACKY